MIIYLVVLRFAMEKNVPSSSLIYVFEMAFFPVANWYKLPESLPCWFGSIMDGSMQWLPQRPPPRACLILVKLAVWGPTLFLNGRIMIP